MLTNDCLLTLEALVFADEEGGGGARSAAQAQADHSLEQRVEGSAGGGVSEQIPRVFGALEQPSRPFPPRPLLLVRVVLQRQLPVGLR